MIIEPLWNLKQVSGFFNVSYSAFRKNWRARLLPHGVNPVNVGIGGKGVYRFVPDEVRRAVEGMRIIGKGA